MSPTPDSGEPLSAELNPALPPEIGEAINAYGIAMFACGDVGFDPTSRPVADAARLALEAAIRRELSERANDFLTMLDERTKALNVAVSEVAALRGERDAARGQALEQAAQVAEGRAGMLKSPDQIVKSAPTECLEVAASIRSLAEREGSQ